MLNDHVNPLTHVSVLPRIICLSLNLPLLEEAIWGGG